MHLHGWTNPLPEWLESAIRVGTIIIVPAKDFDYLQGRVINPHGIEIRFL